MAIYFCVARPQTNCIIDVGVESHDTLYQNPSMKPGALNKIFKETEKSFYKFLIKNNGVNL